MGILWKLRSQHYPLEKRIELTIKIKNLTQFNLHNHVIFLISGLILKK